MAILEINKNPSPRELRWFGLITLAFFAVVAGIFYWRTGSGIAAKWIVGIPAGLTLLFYAIPPLRRPFYVGWMHLIFPIGWLFSHVILGIVYFGLFTLVGLIMRLVGYDPLKRRFDRHADSYWVKREPLANTERYFRQF